MSRYLTQLYFSEPVRVVIAGDLFEKEADIHDPEIWRSAGSDDLNLQLKNRAKAIAQADFVVPGHGPMFKVTEELRQKVLSDAEC